MIKILNSENSHEKWKIRGKNAFFEMKKWRIRGKNAFFGKKKWRIKFEFLRSKFKYTYLDLSHRFKIRILHFLK